MSRSPFDPGFEALPDKLPIFPLTGVLLLPGGRLPLNIFEPRYLALFDDALSGNRLVGMIQPSEAESERDEQTPAVYGTGCAGRITSFSESDDGRYLVTLTGLIRFDVGRELAPSSYRLVEPDYGRFRHDLEETDPEIDRPRLLAALKTFFNTFQIEGDWDSIEQAPTERLITSLSMLCPFEAWEKQALLESETVGQRAEALTALLEMSVHERDGETARHGTKFGARALVE